MLFAVKYRPQASRTEADSKHIRELLMKWEAPESVEVKHHFHYVSGGGVLIVETQEPAALYETVEPFKPLVEFDVEPVINYLAAVAISSEIDEWVISVSADSPGSTGRA